MTKPDRPTDPDRMRRNPFALTLILVAAVSLVVGGALVVTAAMLEHVVKPTDAVAGAAFSAASTPWLFVGSLSLLLWLAVAAVRWHSDNGR